MGLRHFLPCLGAAALFLSGCAFGGGGEVIAAGKRKDARAVAWQDADGSRHTLAEYKGKVVLVDVWATWCPPCRKALPEVAELQRKGGTDFVVLAISVDKKGWEDVKPFLGQHPELGLRAAVPDGPTGLEPFGSIPGIPTTLVIDREGRIRTRWSGFLAGRAEKALQQALAERG
jgi:thiol-disulfide isomerase/thioredoxin